MFAYGYQIFLLKLQQHKDEVYLTNIDSSMSLPSSMSVTQFCYSWDRTETSILSKDTWYYFQSFSKCSVIWKKVWIKETYLIFLQNSVINYAIIH